MGWLQTLSELKHPQHFQAAQAGTRTLLEIAIDLALLHHDRTHQTPAKILAWERSAKLNAAERTRRCFDGRELPAEHVERVAFIDREGASVRAERALMWPNRKPESHPQRWTGRALNEDATAADQFGRYGFADFYDGRFAELCWGTHGSGLTGVRFVPEEHFPGIIAFAFHDSAWLGTLICELSLRYFEKFDEILQERFRQMEQERQHWSQRAYAQANAVPQGFPRC